MAQMQQQQRLQQLRQQQLAGQQFNVVRRPQPSVPAKRPLPPNLQSAPPMKRMKFPQPMTIRDPQLQQKKPIAAAPGGTTQPKPLPIPKPAPTTSFPKPTPNPKVKVTPVPGNPTFSGKLIADSKPVARPPTVTQPVARPPTVTQPVARPPTVTKPVASPPVISQPKSKLKLTPKVQARKVKVTVQHGKPSPMKIDLTLDDSPDKTLPAVKVKSKKSHPTPGSLVKPSLSDVVDLTQKDEPPNDFELEGNNDDPVPSAAKLSEKETEFRAFLGDVAVSIYSPLLHCIRCFEVARSLGNEDIRLVEVLTCVSLRVFNQIRSVSDMTALRPSAGHTNPAPMLSPHFREILSRQKQQEDDEDDDDEPPFVPKEGHLQIMLHALETRIDPKHILKLAVGFLDSEKKSAMCMFLKGIIESVCFGKVEESLESFNKAWKLSEKKFFFALFQLQLTRLKLVKGDDIPKYAHETGKSTVEDIRDSMMLCVKETGCLKAMICAGWLMLQTNLYTDDDMKSKVIQQLQTTLFKTPKSTQLFNMDVTSDERWKSFLYSSPIRCEMNQAVALHVLCSLCIQTQDISSLLKLQPKVQKNIYLTLIFSRHLTSFLKSLLQSKKLDIEDVMLTKIFRCCAEICVFLKKKEAKHRELQCIQPQLFVLPWKIYVKHRENKTAELGDSIDYNEIQAAKIWVKNERMLRSVQKVLLDEFEILPIQSFKVIGHVPLSLDHLMLCLQ